MIIAVLGTLIASFVALSMIGKFADKLEQKIKEKN